MARKKGKRRPRNVYATAHKAMTGLTISWKDPAPFEDGNTFFDFKVGHPNPVYNLEARGIWKSLTSVNNPHKKAYIDRRRLAWRVTLTTVFVYPNGMDQRETAQFVLFTDAQEVNDAVLAILEELTPMGENPSHTEFELVILGNNQPVTDHYTFEDGEQEFITESAA